MIFPSQLLPFIDDITYLGCWCWVIMLKYVGDKNGQNRHRHLKFVTNI